MAIQLEKYESVAAKINEHGGHAFYPIAMPSSSMLGHNGIKFRKIVCKYLLSLPSFLSASITKQASN